MRNVTGIAILVTSLAFALIGCTREPIQPVAKQAVAKPAVAKPAVESRDAPACPSASEETSAVADLTVAGEPCGGIVCRPGLRCCNPTCNHCTPKGVECTQQSCN